MATVCGFGQIPDLACKSLCCYGRVVLDRNCNLFVANANIESVLTVEVGGNVNFTATTVDFKNAAVDFSGASITGLTGEIQGNFTIGELEVLGNLSTNNIFANSVCASVLKGQLTGDVVGNLCGNIETYSITAKGGGDIEVVGNLSGNVTGKLIGDSVGTHCGPVQTDDISEKTVDAGITVMGNLYGTLVGSVCITGDLATDTIREKTPGSGITFDGGIIANSVTVDTFSGNLSGEFCGNVVTNSIEPKTPAGEIIISSTGSVLIPGILTVGTVFIGSLNLISIAPSPGYDTVTVEGNLNVQETMYANIVCGNVVSANMISSKNPGEDIVFTSNISAMKIESSDIAVTSLTSGRIPFATTDGLLVDDPDFTYNSTTDTLNLPSTGELSIGGSVVLTNSSLSFSGTQVVTTQQTATANVGAATAATLTAGIGTADQTLQLITGSGADADINDNFEDCADEINKLITDVASVRSQLNLLLHHMRTHGLIAT